MKPPSAGSGAHRYQQTHTNTNHTNTTQNMKYTKLLFLSAIPMLSVIILGVALKAPWWQILIAALVVDFLTDIAIISSIRRDNPANEADDW